MQKIYEGFSYSNLTAIRPLTSLDSGRWAWKCTCGREVSFAPSRVLSGEYKDCGCAPKTCACGQPGRYLPYRKAYTATCMYCRGQRTRERYKREPKVLMFNCAKARAKKAGMPFNITVKDFDISENCPILGIPLRGGDRKEHDNAPSLDKIIPELGYVKGNVEVVSHRANRIKSDATLQELESVVAWLKSRS